MVNEKPNTNDSFSSDGTNKNLNSEYQISNLPAAAGPRHERWQLSNSKSQKMLITLPENSTKETFKKLSEIFDKCESGNSKVYLKIKDSKLETPYSIKNYQDASSEIKKTVPGVRIEIY